MVWQVLGGSKVTYHPVKPCKYPPCSSATSNTSGYCDQCIAAGKPLARQGSKPYSQAKRKRATASQRGYGARWRRVRAEHLKSESLCRACKARSLYVPADVVDHVIPHRGDMKLFWDPDNLQSLCAHCHNSEKQRQERWSRGAGVKSLRPEAVDRTWLQFLSLRKNQNFLPNAVEHSELSAESQGNQ